MAEPTHCGLRHKIASKCLQVFEAMMAKILLIIAICSIVYSDTWRGLFPPFSLSIKKIPSVPVFINFSFFTLAIFAMVTYAQCYRRVQPAFVLPMLIHLSVCIFWIFIWLYASVASITTGYLWSLEWLGGPRSSRDKTSPDIKDPNYANPDETHPEIKKSIRYGMLITVASLVVLCVKCIAWIIARRTWRELRQRRLDMENEKVEEESDLGAASPSYPVAVRTAPAAPTPPPAYETEPLKRLRFSEEATEVPAHRMSHMESAI